MTPRDGADARSGKSSRQWFLLALVCSAFVVLAGLCEVARAEAAPARAKLDSQRSSEDVLLLGLHDSGASQQELGFAEPEDSDQDASLDRAGLWVAGRAASVASSDGKVKLVARRAHVPSPRGSPELARAPPAR